MNEDHSAELPLQDGFVASSKTCKQTDRRPHIQVNSDMAEADGCRSDRGETRKWVVCEGGVLIEAKVNHAERCVETTQNSVEIVDQNEQNTDETASTVQPCVRFVCTKKSTQSSPSDCHYKTNNSEHPSTSCTHAPTPSVLGHHQNNHTDAQPDTCGNVYTFAVCQYAKQPDRPYRPLSHGCCVCGGKFRSSSVLTEHQRTHTEVNWFVCYTCGESFKTPEDFLRHEKTHVRTVKTRHASNDSLLPSRRHLCSACGELFNRSDTLHAHERMHERSIHVCSTCGHSFTTMPKLDRHAKSHWKDPYICDICGNSFLKLRFLKSHTKMAHTRGTRGKRFSAEYLVKLRKKIHTYVKKRSSRGKSLTKSSERAWVESVAGVGVTHTNPEPHINPVSLELSTPSSPTNSSDQSNPIDTQSSCSKTSHADTSHTPNQMVHSNTKQYTGEKRHDETISRVDASCPILEPCVTSSPACSEPSSDDQINEVDKQCSCTTEADSSHTPNQMIQTKTNQYTGEKHSGETSLRVDATCPILELCVTSSSACSEPFSDNQITEIDDECSCTKEAEAHPSHELNQVTQTITKRYTCDQQKYETISGVSVSLTKCNSGSSICTEQSTPTSPRSGVDTCRVVQKQSACKGPPTALRNPQSIRKRASLAVSRKPHYPTCSVCGKVFKNSRLLDTHQRIHKDVSVPLIPKPFVCTMCARSFVMRRELNTHEYDVHTVKRYRCAMCTLSFRTFYGLKNHKAKIHPGSKVRYTDIRTHANNCASVLRAEKYIQSRCYKISCFQPPVCIKVNHSVRVTSRFVKSADTRVSEHL